MSVIEVNISLTFTPSSDTAPMTTAMINANITAYSVAVGPSSLRRNSRARSIVVCIALILSDLIGAGFARAFKRKTVYVLADRSAFIPKSIVCTFGVEFISMSLARCLPKPSA